jgi:hypothetical protein
LITSADIAYRRRIQSSQDKRANVMYPTDLRVEHVTTAASPPEDGDGGVLEEAVVGANCRAAATASASRAVVEAYSSSRRRVMVRTSLSGLKGGHLVGDALL